MALYTKALKAEERARLDDILRSGHDDDLSRRARIIFLSDQRVGVQEISAIVALHPINVRKWIHRFNRYGVNGLFPRRSPGRPRLFSEDQRRAIVGMATTDPQDLGLGFDSWSLQRLRYQLTESGITSDISPETIRQELLRSGLVFERRRWVKMNGH
jgi:transposase